MKNKSVPLVGGYYADDSRAWSSQDVVNWLPTQAEKAGTRTPSMLKTPPGLREFALTPANPLTLSGHLTGTRIYDTGTYQYGETGGVPPYGDITVTTGALPTGATMDTDGLVTYTYTAPGAFSWTISGDDSNGTIATNPDSLTISSELITNWSLVVFQSPNTAIPQSTACADGIMFIGGDSGEGFYSTDSGTTWVELTGLVSGWAVNNAIKYNGDWYLLSNNSTGSVAIGDTFVFTTLSNAPSVVQNSIAVLGGRLCAGAYYTTYSSIVRMVTPGAAWETISTGFLRSTYGDIRSMCDANGHYFFLTTNGAIFTTTDFVTFSLSYNPADASLRTINYFYATNTVSATRNGKEYYSSDLGATWDSRNPPAEFAALTRAMIIASDSNRTIYSSTDGINWSVEITNNYEQMMDLASTDGSIAVVACLGGKAYVGTT